MNSFCKCLRFSLLQKFKIEAYIYISKKRKIVHMSFLKPLLSYPFFDFIKSYWQKKKFFILATTLYIQILIKA